MLLQYIHYVLRARSLVDAVEQIAASHRPPLQVAPDRIGDLFAATLVIGQLLQIADDIGLEARDLGRTYCLSGALNDIGGDLTMVPSNPRPVFALRLD